MDENYRIAALHKFIIMSVLQSLS